MDVCVTSDGFFYIPNRAAIDEIVAKVREGIYCTILGPRYCQKSMLLSDIVTRLEATGDEFCLLLDLEGLRTEPDSQLLGSFALQVEENMQGLGNISFPLSSGKVTDGLSLRRFLEECVTQLRGDLVLLVDHLERIRIGPLKSLLKALRSLHDAQSPDAPYRLVVVIATSLSVAELSLGPTSPFNIAHPVLIQDLTREQSERLISQILEQQEIELTASGHRRCIEAIGGDRYLIPTLCHQCAQITARKGRGEAAPHDVDEAIVWFLEVQADQYPPLQETIRALEASPAALIDVLKILEEGEVLGRDLQLGSAIDINELQLTGAVKALTTDSGKVYSIRNQVYERYLRQYFDPEQVVHVLRMVGQWDRAIPYLRDQVSTNRKHRSSFLGLIVNSIYTAPGVQESCENLGRWLSQAFAAPQVRVYLVDPEQSKLILVDQVGFEEGEAGSLALSESQRPEVRAYTGKHYLVSEIPGGDEVLCVPLLRDDVDVVGVVAIQGLQADPLSEDFLELLAFLRPVGKAVGSVIDRERRLLQLTILHDLGRQVTSSLDLDQVLETTVKSAIQAVPAAQRGSLCLWSDRLEKLVIRAQVGFRSDIVDVLQLNPGDGYAGRVYEQRQPVLLGDVSDDPQTQLVKHPDPKARSAICVPLEVWGTVIGVLCLENVAAHDTFQQGDLELLSTFGAQAAIAIQNARLYTELHNLGMRINREDLGPRRIFRQVVQSIIRISDAKAANMLLLRDTDDPALAVAQKPVLSVSEGMGPDFDDKIKPRKGGLTYLVLQEQRPLAVSEPGQSPGINPLPFAGGIQAYLCLPLRIHESVIGVLFVHHDKPHTFSDNEIEMLSLYANQAALAIENAAQREELTMTKAVAWMGIVFSSLAHRIAQKTGAIRNTVWRLRQSLHDQPSVLERLDRIDEAALSISQIPGRALLPHEDQVEPVELNDLIRNEILRWCRSEDGIKLGFDGLTPEPTTVSADPKWLAVVLEMLTQNAMQAMRHSTTKELVVNSEIRGQRVVVEMTNVGAEIPDPVRKQLFKAPIPRDQGFEGSGVGLLIARTIMRRYGGDLQLLRTDQQGTTFSFWLPRVQT